MGDYFEPGNEELLRDFFIEAEGQLAEMERVILVLEDDHHNVDALDGLFRAAHTLKGAAATVQMEELERFTHKVEDLLDRLRGEQLTLNSDIVDLLLSAIDITGKMIEARQQGTVFSEDTSSIQQRIIELATNGTPTPEPPVEASPPTTPVHLACPEGQSCWHVRVTFNPDHPMKGIGQVQVYVKARELYPNVQSSPPPDVLSQDLFFPQVDYYLCSELPQQQLEQQLAITDVTVSVQASLASVEPSDENLTHTLKK